jgi:uncharacterized membrane protein (Fun14 family)
MTKVGDRKMAFNGITDILTPLVVQLGIGGVGGFIVGYALKKLAKIVVVIIGLFFLALFYLSYQGVINIDFDKFLELMSSLLGLAAGAQNILAVVMASLPFAGSFTVGFLAGFKLG